MNAKQGARDGKNVRGVPLQGSPVFASVPVPSFQASGVKRPLDAAPAGPSLTVAPFAVDIDRLLYDLNSTFNPLGRNPSLSFQVSRVQDGCVFLSVALPEGMTRAFVSFLESMQGLIRCIDIKSRAAAAEGKIVDAAENERREDLQAAFREEVCSLFDGFISQGHESKEAVKLTNKALKGKNHPWANYEAVSSVLRAEGRFRKVR